MDEQAVLIDEVVSHQGSDEFRAAVDLKLVARLTFQLRDRFGEVAPKQRRVGPLHPVQADGGDVLAQPVQPGRPRSSGSGFPLLCITPSRVRWEVAVSRITRSLSSVAWILPRIRPPERRKVIGQTAREPGNADRTTGTAAFGAFL